MNEEIYGNDEAVEACDPETIAEPVEMETPDF